jgi:hypothetical protein
MLSWTADAHAQGGPPPAGGRGAQPPRTAKAAAPVDVTGYWVSVVTEDWRWRMVTPAKGDFAGVPLNRVARQLGAAWDPAKDDADGNQCKAYGAAAIMRVPGRLHVTWADDNTLQIDTDAGTQTRLLRFAPAPGAGAAPTNAAPASAPPASPARVNAAPANNVRPSWQGQSVAKWEGIARGPGEPDFLPIGLLPREGTRGRSLEVVTTNLRPGYLRKNGVPYGARTTLREYVDLSTERNGDIWFVVTTIVEDPDYLTTPFVTSSNFKKQADATGWAPTPCTTR